MRHGRGGGRAGRPSLGQRSPVAARWTVAGRRARRDGAACGCAPGAPSSWPDRPSWSRTARSRSSLSGRLSQGPAYVGRTCPFGRFCHEAPCSRRIRRCARGDAGLLAPSAASAGHARRPARSVPPPKVPVMTGGGGAVASVDEVATQVGIDVLRRGGNAADAAVAAAATLGVTEPFSSGIGGGGFLVYYDAKHRTVQAVDGRETAPRTFTSTTFTDGAGTALDFNTVVNSGLSVGVPGTPALWDTVARRWGTQSFADLMKPAQDVARARVRRGRDLPPAGGRQRHPVREVPGHRGALPQGRPAAGHRLGRSRNPDMAKAYGELRAARRAARSTGASSAPRCSRPPSTRRPATAAPSTRARSPLATCRDYRALLRTPTTTSYRGLDVRGMPVPSSGGIAVGESLNLLEAYDRQTHQSISDVDETPVPAPVQRGDRDGVRRPQPVDRQRARRADPRAHLAGLRGRARLRAVQPDRRGHPSAAVRQPRRVVLVLASGGQAARTPPGTTTARRT